MAPKKVRKPNDLLQAARSRMRSPTGSGRTMSRQELADLINRYTAEKTAGTRQTPPLIDADYIGRYEVGRHRWPDALVREGFCAVLGVEDPADLGFYIDRRTPTSSDEHPAATDPGPVLPTPDSSGDGLAIGEPRADRVAVQADTGWAEMLRRTVLTGPPAFAALHLLDSFRLRRASGVADPETVRDLAAVAAHYRRAYQMVPASRLLPAAQAHLDVVMSLRPEWQPEAERHSLLTTAGEMAALAGVLLGLDAAHHLTALSYFDFGWEAARAADNVELQTVMLGCRSFALANGGGDHTAGLQCADFAREVGNDGASAQTRAWVAAVASERCASLRDVAGCDERLDESRVALTGEGSDEIVWRGIGGFNAAKLRAYEGGDRMRLRRYRDAEAILDDALAQLDDSMPRHRGTALIDRAEARLGANDVDAACADARQALHLVTQVQHTGNLDRIAAVTARGAATGAASARILQRDVRLVLADHGLLGRLGTA